MACNGGILSELNDLVCQIGDCCNAPPPCCPEPCCPPCCFPFAQVCMTCPPPILAPTSPHPVKPLALPCPNCGPYEMSAEEGIRRRYDNFYNNYNLDWHTDGCVGDNCPRKKECTPAKQQGIAVDGKSPCCDEPVCPEGCCCPLPGCPTGFKPCTMKLRPPPGCHPYGIWCAEVQPCPPKPKKKLLRPNLNGECNK